ncbi:uncharacterized protein Z518_00934 [Rhinocladiella mackenziei CBS 650.93]|uniref:Uncharacterized protein n=1 Tax=Rhinocladiella mackenziei CBS 650.93 TaxID=1442369 RepID=A0A0D2HGQ1_9EURO|nr:uncharacterized protein Z518_00934 [Rhinocladiella mackenziei CBS 650.93]KIX09853.1 hypothetical protein Z518_00934 [Rhinocladiella mackenziei CBS 650.93]
MSSYHTAKYPTPISTLDTNPSERRVYVVITSVASHIAQGGLVQVAHSIAELVVNRMAEHIHNVHPGPEKSNLQAFAVHPGTVLTPPSELHNTQKGDVWNKSKPTFLLFVSTSDPSMEYLANWR